MTVWNMTLNKSYFVVNAESYDSLKVLSMFQSFLFLLPGFLDILFEAKPYNIKQMVQKKKKHELTDAKISNKRLYYINIWKI